MCGIAGIYNYDKNDTILNDTLEIMKKLQHRGKDSYGLSFYNNKINIIKKKGQINNFQIDVLENIVSCIGHLKYKTSNMDNKNINVDEIQPICDIKHKNIAIVHNGNIPNLEIFDTKYIYDIIVKFHDIRDGLVYLIDKIPASYSIIVQYYDFLYVLKDKYSIRPLSYGYKSNNIHIASESVGLTDCINITEVNGGQILEINNDSIREIYNHDVYYDNICAFEFIYFMNPNSFYKDISVKSIRELLAKRLTMRETHNFDDEYIVIGVPNSGIVYGKEYSKILNLNYLQLIQKNTNERTFISIDESTAKQTCHKKFLFLKDKLKDKKVIIIDDTIVKGNVIRHIINNLKICDVKEIHVRIPSPPVIDICQLGIPINDTSKLLMYKKNTQIVCEMLNINSLIYLLKEDLEMIPFDTYKECFGGGIADEIIGYNK